jgi:ABC-2 type transport system ATP-binding protein
MIKKQGIMGIIGGRFGRERSYAMDKDLLKIDGITKRYEAFLLNDISFQVKAGEIVGLVGENGAGKTTLLDIVVNNTSCDSGSVHIFGKNICHEEKALKQDIGIVGDACNYFGCFSPADIAMFLRHIYKNWDSSLFIALLNQFNVIYTQRISDMSSGTKSKMLLAIALAHKPSLLILDEITSGLDPIVRSDVLRLLKDFVSASDKAVLFSTHITSDLENIADRIVFLHKGSLLANQDIAEIRAIIAADNNLNNLDDYFFQCVGEAREVG